MSSIIRTPLTHGLMITAFVAIMMIAVEYVSVLSGGAFQRALSRSRWTQYAAAVLLGATPGCLGAFTVVALYSHRLVPLGAVVGAMIATSGDESFVMLALFPSTALWLTLGLAAVGLVMAPVIDLVARESPAHKPCDRLVVHPEETCRCFPGREILDQWRRPSGARIALTISSLLFLSIVASGVLDPQEGTWIRVTLLLVGIFGVFVVSTVPDHFLREHLWQQPRARGQPP